MAVSNIREIANKLSQYCYLVMQSGRNGLVILRKENPGATVFIVKLGAGLKLVRSCSGQVLLAFGDDMGR